MSRSPVLPPYLSYSTTLITRPGGATETSSTLIQIPLTYYGPSIPLGTNGIWTYGGPTSPAFTSAATAFGTASFASVPTAPTTALGTASFTPGSFSAPISTAFGTASFTSGPLSGSIGPATTALATATFSSSPAVTPGPPLTSSVSTTLALATATFASPPAGTSGLSTTSVLASATFASSPASPVTTAASPVPSVSILTTTVTVIISVAPIGTGSSFSTALFTTFTASSASTSSSSAIPSSITSIPTSTSTSSSTLAIPGISSSLSSPTTLSSTSSRSQLSSTVPPSSTTSSPTSSPTSTSSPIIRGAIVGIVVGTILGAVFLFLLFLIFLRWRRRRQNGGYQTPIWTGWEIVEPVPAEGDNDQDRPPGEGSPRGSGEEGDSLLRRSRNAGAIVMTDTSGRLISVPGAAAGAGAAAAGGSHSGTNGSQSSSSTVSDYGVLLHGSDYTDDPEGSSPTHIPARPSTELGFIGDRGHIIPPSELLRMEAEQQEQEHLMRDEPSSSREAPEQYSPLLPPPRLDPDRTAQFSQKVSSASVAGGSVHDLDDPMVLTARRVRMSQIGPREIPVEDEPSPEPEPGPSAGWGSLGLGGIARLSRLSWFKNFRENLQDSPTRTSLPSKRESRPTSYVSRGLSDNDVESGRALLDDEQKRTSRTGLDPRGERPISAVSAKSAVSGSTVYHDARSLAGTPPPLPPLPRAFLSGSPTDVSHSPGGATEPPSYESGQMHSSRSTLKDSNIPHGVDVLDLPAPPSLSKFSSASSRGSMPFPPGLVQLPTPRSWYESSSSEGEPISIDILEDEPPRAGDGWRVLARNANLGHSEHRSSFGIPQLVHSHDLTAISEVGSLHSMRSHLSPFSARSSGSAPASSRHNFSGSNSSKPSAHSHGRTTSSGLSLAHSGSISSDGRRRLRGPVSPALSAFGYPDNSSPTGQFPAPAPPPPPYIPRSPLGGVNEPTVRSVTTGTSGTSITGSADTEATYTNNLDYVGEHITGDSHLLTMPWATGLDDD